MSEMFLVQKDGLNPPPIKRQPPPPRRKFPVQTMDVGDTFFVPGRTTKSVSAYISRITKSLPGKFTTQRDWALPVAMIGDQRRWESCAEGAVGAEEGVTVKRVE